MAKPVLYSYFRSAASWRVRIALAYKGLDYEYRPVTLDAGQQYADDYMKMNPMAQVPTLLIDGLTLNQSLPIIEYLDETRPHNKLLPQDAVRRVQARTLAEMMNSGIHPLQNLKVYTMVAEWCGDDGKKNEWANFWINKGMAAIEKLLQQTSGRFCVGDQFTVADVCLVPQVYGAVRFKVDLNQFPIISRIDKELQKMDAVRTADAFIQPDCPSDLRKK